MRRMVCQTVAFGAIREVTGVRRGIVEAAWVHDNGCVRRGWPRERVEWAGVGRSFVGGSVARMCGAGQGPLGRGAGQSHTTSQPRELTRIECVSCIWAANLGPCTSQVAPDCAFSGHILSFQASAPAGFGAEVLVCDSPGQRSRALVCRWRGRDKVERGVGAGFWGWVVRDGADFGGCKLLVEYALSMKPVGDFQLRRNPYHPKWYGRDTTALS